jgi:predicted enzyme related to lactoylglutathione lyase
VLADEDLEAEVERLEDLGATIHNWAEGDGGVWCVMLDPQGNEFCVMPPDDEVA